MTMRQAQGTRTFIFHTHPLYAELVFLQDTFHTRVEILSRGVAEKLRERNGNDTFDESVPHSRPARPARFARPSFVWHLSGKSGSLFRNFTPSVIVCGTPVSVSRTRYCPQTVIRLKPF